MDTNTKAFLTGLSPDIRAIVSALRTVVWRAIPHATESVVWGSFSYHRPDVGGRVKGSVCLIVVKRGRVRLDFIHGVRLSDPSGLLQGRQVSKRFVPIETAADAERPELAALIRQAATLDPSERPASATTLRSSGRKLLRAARPLRRARLPH